jgi:hypothetical protein
VLLEQPLLVVSVLQEQLDLLALLLVMEIQVVVDLAFPVVVEVELVVAVVVLVVLVLMQLQPLLGMLVLVVLDQQFLHFLVQYFLLLCLHLGLVLLVPLDFLVEVVAGPMKQVLPKQEDLVVEVLAAYYLQVEHQE